MPHKTGLSSAVLPGVREVLPAGQAARLRLDDPAAGHHGDLVGVEAADILAVDERGSETDGPEVGDGSTVPLNGASAITSAETRVALA